MNNNINKYKNMVAYIMIYFIIIFCFLCNSFCLSNNNSNSNNNNNVISNPIYNNYTILLDAGSTGTRIYIYNYDNNFPSETIQELSQMKINIAMSTLYGNSTGN
jgi:hypothetical protein